MTSHIAHNTSEDSELIAALRGKLDPASREPVYQQLAQLLGAAIQSGQVPVGFVLPPEPEFARQLGISRHTVSQALGDLARRGLVTRRRRVGTVVAQPYIEQPLGSLYSFLRTLTAQGHLPVTRILSHRPVLDAQASPLLTGRPDGLVLELTRLRLVDDEPFATETLYLPLSCGEALPSERLVREPLYDLLYEFCQIKVTRAVETLRPVTLEPLEATLLRLPTGDAAFLVERTSFAAEQPVEHRRSLIRGDRYRFRVELEGSTLS